MDEEDDEDNEGYENKLVKLGLVDSDGAVISVRFHFVYKNGDVQNIAYDNGNVVIVFEHHVAVYKLQHLFPDLY